MTPTSKYKKLFTDLATPLILIFVDNLRNENQGINKVHRVTVDSNSFYIDVNAWCYILIIVTMESNSFDAFFINAWCYKIIMVALNAKSSENNLN